jgi:predicted outer membrane lipoprotein
VRGVINALLLVFAVFTAHSIIMGAFRRTRSAEVAWIGTGIFILPVLLITLIVRWHLETSLREISVFMLSVAVFFAYSISHTFLALRFVYSDQAMPYFGWLHGTLLTLAFGAGGLLLLAYTRNRYRAAPA